MQRKFDNISKIIEMQCVEEVIARVEEIEDSKVGIIAAEDIIDIVKQKLGPEIYNMGLRDAKKLVQNQIADLEVGIDLLEQ